MKRIKMLLYGEPGVGKSVFAVKSPKPFFVCTDGNYEWLDEFGAKDEDHVNVSSWKEAKAAFKKNFDEYDTIVVDLLEDLFKWCENEYCVRNGIEHVSDVGFGKAYDATRNEFFIEISKLLSLDKNVILICHGITFTTKDRRGVEHTRYAPSSRIPDKVLDMIEGRVRYCLRCYTAAEEQSNGSIVKRRFLSLVPKENEFGIIRGVDENTIPHDIPLDFAEFMNAIGITTATETKVKVKQETKIETKAETKEPETIEPKLEVKPKAEASVDTTAEMKAKLEALKAKKAAVEKTVEAEKPEVVQLSMNLDNVTTPDVSVEIKVSENAPFADPAPTPAEEPQVVSGEDKLAAIKAKLAAMKAKKS